MKWTLLNGSTGLLSSTVNFDFLWKDINRSNQTKTPEDSFATVNGTIGEALGKLYVEKMFPAEAKAKAEKMIHILAYQNRINNLT
jgi:endothelin-converting enzyme/putative endopeptidase